MDNFNFKEKLIKRAHSFSLGIMHFADTLPKNFSVQVIMRQVIRSATSIGANIVEAQAASSRKDFTNFLNHALKSANETKYWLALLADYQKIEQEKNPLFIEVGELANILGSSITKLRKN